MTTIYVEFSDASEQRIVTILGGIGDEMDYPYQGTINSSDPRYATFFSEIDSYAQLRPGLVSPVTD